MLQCLHLDLFTRFLRAKGRISYLGMVYSSLKDFLAKDPGRLGKGPVAIVIAEDFTALDETIEHNLHLGFDPVIVLYPAYADAILPEDDRIIAIHHDTVAPNATTQAVNAIIAKAPGTWIYYCYNAEFLYFPFCESRSIAEMVAFHTEERRDAVLSYVVDLYARDLNDAETGVSLDEAMLDRSGYYALARPDENNHPKERQLDFFGGLRWRFEEHIPENRRRIDRIAIFRAKQGLELLEDHTFNDPEYNTYSCPWHNNITVAIASFRTAKALKLNAGSSFDIQTFTWHNSVPFEWHSEQLMRLGLMESGQWF